jgi:dTDP-3-amino-3,4,6-trideoxy-alpha-D-glucose transaminase
MKVPFLDLGAAADELSSELETAWKRVMRSGRYVLGTEVTAFEEEFAAYCGARHCIGVANGLEALALVLEAVGVGRGDEVIVPSNTFIATWLAVTATGATPVPVDPDPRTFTIVAAGVEPAITARTRAVIPVHLYGHPVDLGPIVEVARPRGIAVIEDAAQAHGARLHGRRCGSIGNAAAFSFYPAKNLGAYGDAGAVTTDDGALADRLRILRNYGSRDKYDNEVPGWNSRLDELQAALLRVRLRHLDEWNDRRRAVAAIYFGELAGAPALQLPTVADGVEPVWHQFVVRHPARDALAAALRRAGIETMVHYPIPPHRSGAYAELAGSLPALPIAERLAGEVLSLPVGPHLGEARARAVAEAVVAACTELDVRPRSRT